MTQPPTATSEVSTNEDPTTVPVDRAAVWHDMVLAAHLLQTALERQCQRDGGISHGHLMVLALLDGAERQTLGLKTLGEMLRFSPSRVSHALTTLEHRGLVARGRAPGGRRAYEARLTARGQLLVARVLHAQRTDVRDFLLDSLTAADAAALGTLSSHVVEILERTLTPRLSFESSRPIHSSTPSSGLQDRRRPAPRERGRATPSISGRPTPDEPPRGSRSDSRLRSGGTAPYRSER
jgi:DNA-binding MarR family transcriptional regulator